MRRKHFENHLFIQAISQNNFCTTVGVSGSGIDDGSCKICSSVHHSLILNTSIIVPDLCNALAKNEALTYLSIGNFETSSTGNFFSYSKMS